MAGIEGKMTILAMDTATLVSSVAVATEERVLAELTAETRFTHSETLVPNIDEVLRLADTKSEELSAVAVSLGPGSFTGLRIGLAAAKAIAYALSHMEEDEILVIAGKGHETYQEINGVKYHFDDKEEIRKCFTI